MAVTWAAVDKEADALFDSIVNIVSVASRGLFSLSDDNVVESTDEYTDDEFIEFHGYGGYLAPYVSGSDSIWIVASKDSSAVWWGVTQSGTPAAFFELNEPLGGPVWEAVDKDD